MASSQEVALQRKKEFTAQDMVVLRNAQYGSVQCWMATAVANPHILVHNVSDSLDKLLADIDKRVVPAIIANTASPRRLYF